MFFRKRSIADVESADLQDLIFNRGEVCEVSCDPDPQVDIVLVHGLQGDSKKTWQADNHVFWPKQLLAETLRGSRVPARILVHGWNADVWAKAGRSVSSNHMLDHAKNMLSQLVTNRTNFAEEDFKNQEDTSEESYQKAFEKARRRPIIFIAHSLGGILVKQALISSKECKDAENDKLYSIYLSTYALIFLGTPHQGAESAKWPHVVQNIGKCIIPSLAVDTGNTLLRTLKTQSETLQMINSSFVHLWRDFQVELYYEALKTQLGPKLEYVVDKESATPSVANVTVTGIEATHQGMCKYETTHSPGYSSVSSNVRTFARNAPRKIAERWRRQDEQHTRTERDSQDLQSGATSTMAPHSHVALSRPSFAPRAGSAAPFSAPDSDPPLIVPQGVNPNSISIGMAETIQQLHSSLFVTSDAAKLNASVLLYCLPGGGKSHVARQYIYTKRLSYPGGVFWINANSIGERDEGLWNIAQKMELKDRVNMRLPPSEQHPYEFINTVRAWFEARRSWLLVFDGLRLDTAEEVADFEMLLPRTAHGSIIFTSVDKSLADRRELRSPPAVRVPHLSCEEACELLFQEMKLKRRPRSKEVSKAEKIVREVERLPLAVCAIGRHLWETGQRLLDYHIESYPSVPSWRKPFRKTMRDLERLKHVEARNLINILCFFRENVPVEMVRFGLHALRDTDIRVKAIDRSSDDDCRSLERPDLNTTFKILIRFALIERNDHDDCASQSSQSSAAGALDSLRMHSVIQAFLRATLLKESDDYVGWLAKAVGVYCESFEAADRRIRMAKGAGLVTDYRKYEVHGVGLMKHITDHEKDLRKIARSSKTPALAAARSRLQTTLETVQSEIKQRSADSAQHCVLDGVGLFSIFDRSGSAVTTEPDTPGSMMSHSGESVLVFDELPPETVFGYGEESDCAEIGAIAGCLSKPSVESQGTSNTHLYAPSTPVAVEMSRVNTMDGPSSEISNLPLLLYSSTNSPLHIPVMPSTPQVGRTLPLIRPSVPPYPLMGYQYPCAFPDPQPGDSLPPTQTSASFSQDDTAWSSSASWPHSIPVSSLLTVGHLQDQTPQPGGNEFYDPDATDPFFLAPMGEAMAYPSSHVSGVPNSPSQSISNHGYSQSPPTEFSQPMSRQESERSLASCRTVQSVVRRAPNSPTPSSSTGSAMRDPARPRQEDGSPVRKSPRLALSPTVPSGPTYARFLPVDGVAETRTSPEQSQFESW
ncbi:MAG: hypothetical protein M1817_004311 [Caeruleum heppii]|nr:MAG: hypothetical protein M1817_004311 [Caeruleum heppii]